MPTLQKPVVGILLATYLLLSSIPFFGVLVGQAVPQAGWIVLVEILAWTAVWAVFQRPAYFHLLLFPAFLAVPVEIYLRLFFAQGISTNHLAIIAETSPLEAAEFLGNKIWWLLALTLVLIGLWGVTFRAALRTHALDWRGWSRWCVMTAVGVIGLAMTVLQLSADTVPLGPVSTLLVSKPASDGVAIPVSTADRLRTKLNAIDPVVFTGSWPFGIGLHGYHFWRERTYLRSLADASARFKFGATQMPAQTAAQVVVMVIGESSRYDRWSLNGYLRDTTPLLRAQANVVPLANVVTAVSATRLSVPILVSRKPATESLRASFREKSFVSAYKEAGFKTFWLSNQMSFGQFDTPVSVYANEADVTMFLNLGGMSKASNLDAILLEPLQHALADPAQKKLIVLHTLGSHWNYSHRYPQSFDKWQPSLFGIDKPPFTDLKIKPQLNNSYDNTILYTDWILNQVVESLKASAAITSLMYVADHGQTLYDGSCRLAFHGHNTQYEFHVPALVWYSEAYRTTYPGKVDRLLHNRRARLSTENVFHSLLDMADVRYPSEQLDYSFLSGALKTHKRYVDSYGWTDYDNATLRSDCREVIDKGKPLVQQR